MSQVTKMVSHELDKPHSVKVEYNGEYGLFTEYKGIISVGFSVEDENLLLLFKGDTELPSVIINVNHSRSIEITEESDV